MSKRARSSKYDEYYDIDKAAQRNNFLVVLKPKNFEGRFLAFPLLYQQENRKPGPFAQGLVEYLPNVSAQWEGIFRGWSLHVQTQREHECYHLEQPLLFEKLL